MAKFKVGDIVETIENTGYSFDRLGMRLEVVECHNPLVKAKLVSGYAPISYEQKIKAWSFLESKLELVNVQKPTILKNGKTKIVFNPPYTIFENDGVVGKAKCSPDDKYDPVVGLELAMSRCVKPEPVVYAKTIKGIWLDKKTISKMNKELMNEVEKQLYRSLMIPNHYKIMDIMRILDKNDL